MKRWMAVLLVSVFFGGMVFSDGTTVLAADTITLITSPLMPTADWEGEIRGIERVNEGAMDQPGNILFIGSSSIRMWSTLKDDFPGLPVINAGYGGSQIVDSIVHFDRLVEPFAPHTIVMFAGSNDIDVGKSARQVYGDFVAFTRQVWDVFPQTNIAFISITTSPARWHDHRVVIEANELIRQYTESDDRLRFIDVYSQMVMPDGTPNGDLYANDRLHLNERGYALWVKEVAPFLDYPSQDVWLRLVNADDVIVSSIEVEPLIAPHVVIDRIRLLVDGETKYESNERRLHTVSLDGLEDGPHNLLLEVTTQDGTQHMRRLQANVRHTAITQPAYGSVLQDDATIIFATGFSDEVVREAVVSLAPFISGRRVDDQKMELYRGGTAPDVLELDSHDLKDGTYDLIFKVTSMAGVVSESSTRIIVRNWQTFEDPLDPPSSAGWLGMIDRKKTVFESEGWEYSSGSVQPFGDDGSRIWTGTGEGYLVWDLSGVEYFTLALYAAHSQVSGVSVAVSPDRDNWRVVSDLSFELISSEDGWHLIEVTGKVDQPETVNFIRVAFDDTTDVDIRLGHVKFVYPAERRSPS